MRDYKFSLAMIVKNEQAVLGRCLDSVKDLFDEIVIVDTGSSDKTKQIAHKYTPFVYDLKWVNDFSLARNFSFEKATGDYVMWLDADDVFPQKNHDAFLQLKKYINKHSPDVVMMKYNISFDDNGNATYSYYRERIVVNNGNYLWQDPVHEVIQPSGKVYYSPIGIEHHPMKDNKPSDRNLKIYENLIKKGAKFSPRQQYYYSRELMFNNQFKKATANLNKFLSMPDAWLENKVSACIDLYKCYLCMQDTAHAKQSLIRSFEFTHPRAQVCCLLADIFFQEKNFSLANYWYKMALKDKINEKSGAFVEKEYYTTYPLLQLCVSYYKMGKVKQAKKWNDKVAKYDNKNPYYLNNVKFFKALEQKF